MIASPPVPCVWIVSSQRRLERPGSRPQQYTVMDHVGALTMTNMGLQPMCYPHVPAERMESLLASVDGILLGGSDTNVHPSLYGDGVERQDFEFDRERDETAH